MLVGVSVLAVGAFALAGHLLGDSAQPRRRAAGLSYRRAGYVLCPQGLGLVPSPKPIAPAAFVLLWLGDPQGRFVEATWGRVLRLDADPNRLLVLLSGEDRPGRPPLQTQRHGFALDQVIWVTADCIPDVLRPFPIDTTTVVCGPGLAARGYGHAAAPPTALADLVGREAAVLLASDADPSPWEALATVRIMDVGPTEQTLTVELIDVADVPEFAYGTAGASFVPGLRFDITWDCVLEYGGAP